MATNKHAIIRYQALDKCFRNSGRKFFIDDLINACSQAICDFDGTTEGIKRRQLFDDIRFMESEQGWSIPLERYKDGKRVFYRYSDSNFSINSQPLTEQEANQLKEALLTISRFKGLPQFEWIDEMITRLESGLGLKQSDKKIIDFEQNPYLKGLEYLTELYNAIIYKKVILVKYKSYKQQVEVDIIFHPYYLKQFNNRWFVFGRNQEMQLIQNLALDRIQCISDSNKVYIDDNETDFSDYFYDVVGVSVNNELPTEKIQVKIEKELWPYIESKPLHGSQKKKHEDENFVTVELFLKQNYELDALLLSFGEGIEVYSPQEYRKHLGERILNLNKKYNP